MNRLLSPDLRDRRFTLLPFLFPTQLVSVGLSCELLARAVDVDVAPDPRYGPTLLVKSGGFVQLETIHQPQRRRGG
jgi:hypothetical protein